MRLYGAGPSTESRYSRRRVDAATATVKSMRSVLRAVAASLVAVCFIPTLSGSAQAASLTKKQFVKQLKAAVASQWVQPNGTAVTTTQTVRVYQPSQTLTVTSVTQNPDGSFIVNVNESFAVQKVTTTECPAAGACQVTTDGGSTWDTVARPESVPLSSPTYPAFKKKATYKVKGTTYSMNAKVKNGTQFVAKVSPDKVSLRTTTKSDGVTTQNTLVTRYATDPVSLPN